MVSRSVCRNVSPSVCMLRRGCCCCHCVAAGADVNLADPNTGNAAQMAAAVGHIEVVERLVEAGCAWPHGKKANTGLGAPVDVVQLLSQKTGISVSSMAEPRTAGVIEARAFSCSRHSHKNAAIGGLQRRCFFARHACYRMLNGCFVAGHVCRVMMSSSA